MNSMIDGKTDILPIIAEIIKVLNEARGHIAHCFWHPSESPAQSRGSAHMFTGNE